MFFIPRCQIWTQQPQGPVKANASNPITKGLAFAALPGVGDVVSGGMPVLSGSSTISANKSGRNYKSPATQVPGAWTYNVNIPASFDITVFVVFRNITAQSASPAVPTLNFNSPETVFFSSTGSQSLFSSTGNASTTITTLTAGQTYALAAVKRGNSQYQWVDGQLATTDVTGNRAVGACSQVSIGRPGGGNNLQNAEYALIAYFNRALNDSEIKSLSANPYQLFDSQASRIFVPVVSTGAVTHATSGAISADAAQVSGTSASSHLHATSGDIAASSAVVSGTSARLAVHATAGAVTVGNAQVSGTALRYRAHATIGAAIAGDAQVSGTAARLAIHATSGAIVASEAVISGTALRYRAHTASGAVTASDAAVSGQAALPGAVTHVTTGAIAATSAAVSGTALRYRAHTTSGALDGASALVSGEARHQSPHVTSGAILSLPATISGIASRASAPVAHATDGTLIAGSGAVSGIATRSTSALSPGQFALSAVRVTRFDCKIQRKVIFTLGVANRVR